jgi:hypothetical protein
LTNDKKGPSGPKPPRRPRSASKSVGDALKTVYDRALQEEIPAEMLDLLGKLG